MSDKDTQGRAVEPDGGTVAQDGNPHREIDYLEREVNLLRPSTPFMRDHLRLIWSGFVVWAVIVFVPVTLTAIAPGVMTTPIPVLEFPLHYFLVGFGAPTGALVLAFWYARKRDQLDQEYGIEHQAAEESGSSEAVATDGGVRE